MSDDLRMIKVHEVTKTNMVRDFLVELMLTKEWNSFVNVLIEEDTERSSNHISDYVYTLGLVKWANEGDYKYEVSVKGRKYLQQQGENNEQ